MQKENPYGSQDFGLRWKGRFVDGGKPHCIYIFRLPTWPTLLKRPLSGKRERKKKKGRRMQMSNPTEGVGNGQLSTGSYYTISPSISFDAADAPFPIFSPALIFPPTRRSVTCTVHIRRRLRRRGLYYAIEAHALLCPNIVSEDTKLHPGPCIIHSEGETLIPARRWRTFHLIPPCCCWYVCSIGTIYNSLDLLIKKSTARSRTTVAGKGK